MTDEPEPIDHRHLRIDLFNGTWELMEKASRTRADDDRMLHMAHASRHHWGFVGTPAHLAFAHEALARGHAIAGDLTAARASAAAALAVPITDEHDREIVLNDLETIPGQARCW